MYFDAYFDNKNDKIITFEKNNKQLCVNTLTPVYEFYYYNPNGEYISIDEQRVSLMKCYNKYDFKKKVEQFQQELIPLFESDHNILFKTLNQYYKNTLPAEINIAFFDIENDIDPEQPDPSKMAQNPTKPITAITIYKKWENRYYTYCIKPDTLTLREAQDICNKIDNVVLCTDETALLKCMLNCLNDVDVLSGWNSDFYDIPYIVGRIEKVLGKSNLCKLNRYNIPIKVSTTENYGKKLKKYDLIGRVHLDYLELYRKHNQQGRDSYSLNSVGEDEVNETKLEYEGTLDELYNNDFELFVRYNIQDTLLLAKIDKKFDYINLHNHIAHSNGVTISSTMGSVAWIDQSIINEAHSLNQVVPDKKPVDLDKPAAGARVADNEEGIYEWIGSIDLASLYPSTIRSLNMSPETMVAQIRPTYTDKFLYDKIEREKLWKNEKGEKKIKWNEVWGGIFNVIEYDIVMNQTNDRIYVDFKTGETLEMTGKDAYGFVKEFNLAISANGTIFRTDKQGIIPHLLTRWFKERKEFKNQMADLYKVLDGIEIDNDLLIQLQES